MMMSTRFVLASASLLAVALAQTKIAFTSVPAEVEAGDTYNITWGGGNDSPVTLTLRKGDPNDLETIEVLADGVRGSSYEWKVDDDLESDNDYALQITQGQNDINYSGQFSVSDGKGSSKSSGSASATSSDNSTSTTSGSSSQTTNGTSSSTESSNSTESSTTTESSSSETSSARTTRSSNTASETDAAQATSAPNSSGSGAMQLGSSVAFAMAVLGAVVLMN